MRACAQFLPQTGGPAAAQKTPMTNIYVAGLWHVFKLDFHGGPGGRQPPSRGSGNEAGGLGGGSPQGRSKINRYFLFGANGQVGIF